VRPKLTTSRCGIVAIAGLPNAGKSTLLNRLVGQKLAITSAKPQSTRDRVTGILTRNDTQMVFADSPGLLEPRYALQKAMRATALRAINDADAILYVVDATAPRCMPLMEAAALQRPPSAPVVTALNKIDLVRDDVREQLHVAVPDAMVTSAITGEGLQALEETLRALLPEAPFLYGADDLSAQPLRYFAAELIREVALEQLEQEVPYSIACTIEEFREDPSPVYIRAVLFVERASQKRILIGGGGSRIREIGRAARLRIETLVESPVYLDLWVKVLHNWRRDANALRQLGYDVPEDS
jgi:GTP-binding protein Era